MTTTTSSSITVTKVLPAGTITEYNATDLQWLIKFQDGTSRFIATNSSGTTNNSTIDVEGSISNSFALNDDGLYRITLFKGDETTSQSVIGSTSVKKITSANTVTI